MNRALMRTVRQRAGDRCEYCHMPSWAMPLPFQIDHIVADNTAARRQKTTSRSPAPLQSLNKGPTSPASTRLGRSHPPVHPRQDFWSEHFRLEGARMFGRTAIGRATVQVLAMNAAGLLLIRAELPLESRY